MTQQLDEQLDIVEVLLLLHPLGGYLYLRKIKTAAEKVNTPS